MQSILAGSDEKYTDAFAYQHESPPKYFIAPLSLLPLQQTGSDFNLKFKIEFGLA